MCGAIGIAVCAIGLSANAQSTNGQLSADDLGVSERLAVRETGVLLELPGLKASAISKLQPSDLVVSKADRILEVTRIARLDPTSEPWTILVYADALSSREQTIRLAAQALAQASDKLTELGPVSIIVAGRDDLSLLDNQRDQELTANALTELANLRAGTDSLALIRRDLDRRAIEDVFFDELSFLRERADRLLVQAANVCSLPPCLLLNISDGFELAPSAAYRGVPLSQLARGAGGATHGEIERDLEQGLAARGWTVVSLALEPTRPDPKGARNAKERHDVGTDFDAWKSTTPGVQTGPPNRKGNRHDRLPSQALEVYTEARLQPLRLLGAATSGATLRVAEQVPLELGRLLDRWWLFYLAEDTSQGSTGFSKSDSEGAVAGEPKPGTVDVVAPGIVQPLSVSWARRSEFQSRRALKKRLGFVPETEPLRTQHWARNPSPTLLTAARLRSLGRERHLVGNLEIQAAAPTEPDIAPVKLDTPAGVRFTPSSDRTRVRISAIGPAGSIRHQVVTPYPAVDDQVAVDLPVWSRRSPAIIEELGSGRWAVLTR